MGKMGKSEVGRRGGEKGERARGGGGEGERGVEDREEIWREELREGEMC